MWWGRKWRREKGRRRSEGLSGWQVGIDVILGTNKSAAPVPGQSIYTY
jgi:hypothetical protein